MTKINIRSPFYLRYDEPALPSVALDCDLINLQNMTIDQFGNITLPDLDYGTIISYTSTDVDFADGKFDTVVSATSRTVTFTISIPANFSNAGDDTIDCDDTFTQPAFVCTGGVTTSGSIPSQALDSGGDSVEIDLTSYFTAGTDPIQTYTVTNSYPTFVSTSISGNTLSIYSINKTGTVTIYVEANDGNSQTCNATQSISITISAAVAYDCDDSRLVGGSIANDGTITNPTVNGTITAIKDTSGGTPITSYSANNTGSARDVTLYFDITVPSGVGYTNAGATVECSKTFTQSSTSLPQFTCEVAGLTGQAIALNGTVKIGTANKGTISGFSPLSFSTVTTDTERTVAFNITPPASGYANSGGADISCNVTMTQPAPEPPATGDVLWYHSYSPYQDGGDFDFLTTLQYNNAGYLGNGYDEYRALEPRLTQYGVLGSTRFTFYLTSNNMLDNINTYAASTANGRVIYYSDYNRLNPSGGFYFRVAKTYYSGNQLISEIDAAQGGSDYWIKVETSGLISEIWAIDLIDKAFKRLA